MSQRAAFCVYSGKGVSDLRNFLTDLFNTITEDMGQDDETEYDEDYDDAAETTPDAEMETGGEDDVDDDYTHHSRAQDHTTHFQSQQPPNAGNSRSQFYAHQPELALQRDRTIRGTPVPLAVVSPEPRQASGSRMAIHNGRLTNGDATRRTSTRAFGQQPVVETSTSPTPSDVASNRSTGTNQSNSAFFRTYQEFHTGRSNGALTPDLNYAEIGHGRGANNGSAQAHPRRGLDQLGPPTTRLPESQSDLRNGNLLQEDYHQGIAWPNVRNESASPSPPVSPTTRELQESVQSALGAQSTRDNGEGRGRRVKRSLRNTISAAESFASTFAFFRTGSNGVHPSQDPVPWTGSPGHNATNRGPPGS